MEEVFLTFKASDWSPSQTNISAHSLDIGSNQVTQYIKPLTAQGKRTNNLCRHETAE